MAIKGKRKSRPRPVARAPRREIVDVRPPFFARRWVQAVGAFAVGILVSIFAIWLTNGLRENSASEAESKNQASARAAVQAWTDRLTNELSGVATMGQGSPPILLPEAGAAIDALAAGDDAGAGTLSDARSRLGKAIKALAEVEVADLIRDQGLDVTETNYVLNSHDKSLEALRVYREAVDVATAAADATGQDRTSLADIAAQLRDRAIAQLNDGYRDLTQAQASVGIAQPPSVPGATGALGLP